MERSKSEWVKILAATVCHPDSHRAQHSQISNCHCIMSLVGKASVSLIDLIPALLPTIPSISIRLPIQSRVPENQNESLNEPITKESLVDTQLPDDFFTNNGILKAAPKKKTSHMKRRQRLYCPGSKHVKLQNHLNRCPSCGNYKRSHLMCMNCYFEIKQFWKESWDKVHNLNPYKEEFANKLDEQVLYPTNKMRPDVKKLHEKEYVVNRPSPLPVETQKKN